MEYTLFKILPAKFPSRRRCSAAGGPPSQAEHQNLATDPKLKVE